MKQKNFYKLVAVVDFLFALALMVFGSIFLSVYEYPKTENFEFFMTWMEDNQDSFIAFNQFGSLAFLTANIAYALTIFFKNKKTEIRIINAPFVFALLNFLACFSGAPVYIFTAISIDINTGVKVHDVVFITLSILSLASILLFALTYLVLETFNRTVVLKRIFAGGIIPKAKGVFKPSLSVIFLSFFFGFVFCPMLYFFYYYYVAAVEHGFEVSEIFYILSSFFLGTGFAVTLLLTNLFRRPLKNFTAAAKRISDGDYKTKVEIFSADEFGDLSGTFNQMQQSLVEKDFMRDTFGKIVSPEIRDYILNNKVSLGGETKDVTVMFCDIRSFTSLSEKLKSEEVVQMLNIYFTAMEKCIAAHRGIINKYIGDAVMAIFGTPVENPNHALDAYLAGLEMRRNLADVNRKFAALGFPEIRNGIGLHSGAVLAGNIGAENRMEFTVIGDTVNVASRIEGLCKEHGKDFLISETTAAAIRQTLGAGGAAETVEASGEAAGISDGSTTGAGTSGGAASASELAKSVGGADSATANIAPPQFLCESPIRGKEEKIGLYWA